MRCNNCSTTFDTADDAYYHNCKKEFKQFFLLGGEKMVSVDIKSCQPALLAKFYNNSEEDQKEKLRYLDILINQDI